MKARAPRVSKLAKAKTLGKELMQLAGNTCGTTILFQTIEENGPQVVIIVTEIGIEIEIGIGRATETERRKGTAIGTPRTAGSGRRAASPQSPRGGEIEIGRGTGIGKPRRRKIAARPRKKASAGTETGPESEIEEEIGDFLFASANLARHLDVDPEAALRAANAKFTRRFARIEARLAERGKRPEDSDLAEMDALWDRAKAEERG